MNTNIQKLYDISRKAERIIIGLMSGTSVDGLDVALCRFRGAGIGASVQLLAFETVAYEEDFKKEIASVFSRRDADLEKVTLLNAWIAQQHAVIINSCLKKWDRSSATVDLIASHGQTIFHAPRRLHHLEKFGNATLQIGDGDHIAVATGITTVSDFRQKHIAAGGEGAPLAAYGDFLLFSQKGENRIMLNIGGIANFTYLPGSLDAAEVFCTDTGAGNTLMDAFIRKHYPGKYFDKNAEIASRGTINEGLLAALKDHDFFTQGFPKTTGPELFNLQYLEKAKERSENATLSNEDILATLTRFSAETIADAVNTVTGKSMVFSVFVSGGGMHNPLLMEHIQSLLPGASFKDTAALDILPDAKEAVLFAVLANEAVSGGGIHFGSGRNGIPDVSMGKISFPL